MASKKRNEYLDIYREAAVNHIKKDESIIEEYGEEIEVEFRGTFRYSEEKKRKPFEIFEEVFAPPMPESLEEFNEGMKMMEFDISINGDPYKIRFEKNDEGKFYVKSLTPDED